jgi:hypothetical protein
VSDSEYGQGAEPLTPTERLRLRPSVDAVALERWLVATAGEARRTVITHFARDVTPDDLRGIYRETRATAEEMAELERSLAEELPPPGPIRYPGPDAPPGALAFASVPYDQYVVQTIPPADPDLRAFWEAIERGE